MSDCHWSIFVGGGCALVQTYTGESCRFAHLAILSECTSLTLAVRCTLYSSGTMRRQLYCLVFHVLLQNHGRHEPRSRRLYSAQIERRRFSPTTTHVDVTVRVRCVSSALVQHGSVEPAVEGRVVKVSAVCGGSWRFAMYGNPNLVTLSVDVKHVF